jgi:hypothetical protein
MTTSDERHIASHYPTAYDYGQQDTDQEDLPTLCDGYRLSWSDTGYSVDDTVYQTYDQAVTACGRIMAETHRNVDVWPI